MHNLGFLRKLIITCQHLFVFRKPSFAAFDFIDLVIHDKALFLLSWKVSQGYKLKIGRYGAAYWYKDHAVVILLKNNTHTVDITISNVWRKTKKRVTLQNTRFDHQTTSYLLGQIKSVNKDGEIIWNTPLDALSIHPLQIAVHHQKPILKTITPQVSIPTPVFKKLTINTENLNYHNHHS